MKVFDSYDSSANKKRFPKEYVKYWELKFLFMATASKRSNQSLGFTYDDYGNYKDSQNPKDSKTRFWKDWSLLKKILYVILNMCTYCIPIILHFILVISKKFLKKK